MKGYEKILQRIRTMRAFLSDEDASAQLIEEGIIWIDKSLGESIKCTPSNVYLALKGAITLDGPNDIASLEKQRAGRDNQPTTPLRPTKKKG